MGILPEFIVKTENVYSALLVYYFENAFDTITLATVVEIFFFLLIQISET